MKRAILIDAVNREVRETTIPDRNHLKDIQTAVGGYIDLAWKSPKGDVLFVDDEGLLKPQTAFFRWAGRGDGQPLAGNGILVGPEQYDDQGEFLGVEDCTLSVVDVRRMVSWLTRAQFEHWASTVGTPCSTFTFVDDKGNARTEVVRTWAEMAKDMPKPPESDEA